MDALASGVESAHQESDPIQYVETGSRPLAAWRCPFCHVEVRDSSTTLEMTKMAFSEMNLRCGGGVAPLGNVVARQHYKNFITNV
jgi:hypothetical protein